MQGKITRMSRCYRLLPLCLAILLPGCFMVRGYVDRPIDADRIQRLQRGVTTKQEVLELFGPPQLIDARELVAVGDLFGMDSDPPPLEQIVSARFFRYQYTRGNGSALILGLFNYVEGDVKSDTLLIFFDGKGVVEDYAVARDTELLPKYGPLSR